MAAAEDMELHQIDIKGAYLNGELTEWEKIFMQQPPGYHVVKSPSKIIIQPETTIQETI
jgi:hypothetical protein